MLINLRTPLVFSLLSCLVSAFSTRFLIEGADEGGKTPMAKETKMEKTEKNDTFEKKDKVQGIEIEVIPIVTEVFTQPEDLFNMTPLKLVAAISAQHLITTVKNIPVAGNSYVDSLNMLENVVKEFNKTAEIIKLTAKYVNISGHYILSTLKEFTEQSCDVKSLDAAMKSVRENFLKTVTDHALGAIKELNEKTKQREMSGSDILISSSYHIVSAFQEMTNQVLNLADESTKKCKETLLSLDITPPSSEQNNLSDQKAHSVFTFDPIPQQGKEHKSIKKDQAKPNIGDKTTQTNLDKLQGQNLENINNQDLTIEYYSPETILRANNAQLSNQHGDGNLLKVPDDLTVENIPLNNILPQQNLKNRLLTQTTKGDVYEKVSSINKYEKFKDVEFENANNQDLTVEVFPPETILKANKGQLSDQKGRLNKPNNLRIDNIPPKKMYFFNPKNGLLLEKPNENNNQKLPTSDKFEIFGDQAFSNPDNLNKHKFTVELVSPETMSKSIKDKLTNHKGEVSKLKVPEYDSPKKISLFQNSGNGMLIETPKKDLSRKTSKVIDRELDSSAVDSLSNVPWLSSDIETSRNNKDMAGKPPPPKTGMNIFDLLQGPSQNGNVKERKCDGSLEPVCGFDQINQKFIIFLNDCKREAHNRFYKTNYLPDNMEKCVSLFASNTAPEAKPQNGIQRTVDLRPR